MNIVKSSTVVQIIHDVNGVGWRGWNYAPIDLIAEGYSGSGTYDNLIYSST